MNASLKQFVKRILIFLKLGANLSDAEPVSLPPAGISQIDPHDLSPQFRLSDRFFLSKSVVKIFRDYSAIEVELHKSFLNPRGFEFLFPRLLMVLHGYSSGLSNILDHSESTTGRAFLYLDLADGGNNYPGELAPDANFYAFSRQNRFTGIGLIPDPYTLHDLYNDVQFDEFTSEEEGRADYQNRKDSIFWRGSTTGKLSGADVNLNQRARFCIDALGYPESIDAKITNVIQFPSNKAAFKTLSKLGVIAPRILETGFSECKATVDLDGNSASWGVFRKYLRLMHVIKPRSNFEMFYTVDQPGETFTVVDGLDDLFRRVRMNANFADNFETAWKGYCFAHEVRKKISSGNATVFPVTSSGSNL